ncbi:MAG: transposase [Verrucomicrobiales bacterium]
MAVKAVAEELRAAENETERQEIHARYAHRFHSLSEFMKGLLIRFTRWFNRTHQRKGTLWEERFKSVIVESGTAARTMAAYIDLNPVRAGMVADPADYRWSSYGEAVGGGRKGNGKKAREGLVRAFLSDEGVGFEATRWRSVARKYRQLMGMALARKDARREDIRRKTYEARIGEKKGERLPEMGASGALLRRVRYFSDGAVIGGKAFVNQAFVSGRERFSERRRDGARKMRGMRACTASTP